MSEPDDIEQAVTLKLALFGWNGAPPRRLDLDAPLFPILRVAPRISHRLPTGADLGKAERAHWLLRGRAAVSDLMELVSSWRWTAHDDHARGHAADLLVDLRAVEAIPLLLEVVSDARCPEALFTHVYDALPRFGDALIAPAIELVAGAPGRAADICDRLVATGVRDERIFELLVRALEGSNQVAPSIAAYRDRRALSSLRAAIERFEADIDHPARLAEITLLEEAFEELGGVLDAKLARHAASWRRRKTAAWLAYLRVERELGYSPGLEEPETREAVRRNLPPIEIVAYAEPLFADDTDWLDALDFAHACHRAASLPDGPEKTAAIAALPRQSLVRKMIKRYHELFRTETSRK